MDQVPKARLSPSMVVALLALSVALGGSALAVTAVKKNSVRSRQIKDGQVMTADVRDEGLAGVDVRDEGLTGADVSGLGSPDVAGLTGADVDQATLFNDDSLNAADVNEFSFAPTARVTYAFHNNCGVAEGTQATCAATCPAGNSVIGGGVVAQGDYEEQVEVNTARPTTSSGSLFNRFEAFYDNNTDLAGANNDETFGVYAICMPAASAVQVIVNG